MESIAAIGQDKAAGSNAAPPKDAAAAADARVVLRRAQGKGVNPGSFLGLMLNAKDSNTGKPFADDVVSRRGAASEAACALWMGSAGMALSYLASEHTRVGVLEAEYLDACAQLVAACGVPKVLMRVLCLRCCVCATTAADCGPEQHLHPGRLRDDRQHAQLLHLRHRA